MAKVEKIKSDIKHDENSIISIYMAEVLENNQEPLNVYSFCKKHKIEESLFYSYFGSIKALKQIIWKKFIENVDNVTRENTSFSSYNQKDKLLTFYFSLFEIFAMNRSYIIFTLESEKNQLNNIMQLKEFRKSFKLFIEENIESPFKNDKIANYAIPVMNEGVWIQFIFILKFWIDDTSPSFEKTDILIEKTITTSSLLMDQKPLESLFDLAKFLYKEKM
jgi:hypothetical protein